MTEEIVTYFGKDLTLDERQYSYDFIENYIEEKVSDWSIPPNTEEIASNFSSILEKFSEPDFNFLLCHAGYIPEFYDHDSSQETLYSKLIEVLVCEWSKRVGFIDSCIQRQKSSKEDITIQVGAILIVCDAKSFRLGRSQSAPNVKDTIKKGDYQKWQDNWNNIDPHSKHGVLKPIGGLVTFPSLHRWKGESDAYLYCTDKERPIIMLFYEHLAYFTIKNIKHTKIIECMENYSEIFPSASKNQHSYFDKILNNLFEDHFEHYTEYMKLFVEIIKEKVNHTTNRITKKILETEKMIRLEIDAIDEKKLREHLIDSRLHNVSGQIIKQLANIKKFRPH